MSESVKTVADNAPSKRYELLVDGAVAGFSTYELADSAIIITHTEIDSALAGKGSGSLLAQGMLDDIRERGLTVVALCPFIKGWIEKHPDYIDLVTSAGK